MSERLQGEELVALIERVFQPRATDTGIAVLVDLPDAAVADHPRWQARREMAAGWVEELAGQGASCPLPVSLWLYPNVRTNNGDLPAGAWRHGGGPLPASADELDPAAAVPFAELFRGWSILLAPTEFSATAPLKVAARSFPIRAATMPGFTAEMIPALRLDYGEVNRRVARLAGLLTAAEGCDLLFHHPQGDSALHLDLRHRSAHASGGLVPEPGFAGNLPSGEAYIVPYEGERAGEPSRTAGFLPVQFGDEVVVYRIQGNRALEVLPGGAAAAAEAAHLRREPAYGNLAELGLGVLAAFGVEPVGEILLDEKLGLHIAFGRSDHFGGTVGPAQFSAPGEVIHIDRVYVPACQPRIRVAAADLLLPAGERLALMRDQAYVEGLFD
ncbi:MAG: hypothetical protein GX178_07965 [Acidobacteria bacterium]|nr:hypothetical protein [Acidobacteriota bacterium]HQP92840.1 hypothetical protein [Thermoanaerobaculia bacterium]